MVRKLLLAALALVLLAGASVPSRSAPPTGPLPISLWYSLPAGQGAFLESMVAEFNASHPYVKVSGRNFASPAALNAALVAGKESPTVALMESSWLPAVAARGHLQKVSAWMPPADFPFNWSIKGNTYLPLWNASHVGGELMALPFFFTTRALIYNPAMLAAGGVKFPPATWEQLRAAAKKTTSTGQWGFYLADQPPADLARNVQVFAWQAGGTLLGPDGQPSFNPGVQKALTFLTDMVKTDKVSPDFAVPSDMVAMRPGSVEDYLRLRAEGVALKVSALPGVEKSMRTTEAQIWSLGLFDSIPPAELYKVREFAFWLLDFPQQRRWAETQPYLAAHLKVFDNPFYRRERESDHQNLRVFLNVLGVARPVDTAGQAAVSLDGMGKAIPPVLRGEKAAQEIFTGAVSSR